MILFELVRTIFPDVFYGVFQYLVPDLADSFNRRFCHYIRNDTDALRYTTIGIVHTKTAYMGSHSSRKKILLTLPSAPLVWLPITTAPGAVRKAIAVYSAWLWVCALTSITIFPL